MEGEFSESVVHVPQRFFCHLLLTVNSVTLSQQDTHFQLFVRVSVCVQASRTQGVCWLRRETEKVNVDEREDNATRDARQGHTALYREKRKKPKVPS